MIRTIAIGILLLVLLTESLGFKLTPVVYTKNGPIQGQILDTVWHSKPYSSFRGIPFARPPVGNLRFKPPVEAKPWTTVLNATQESTACRQLSATTPDGVGLIGSEDCLYLNVYTPQTQFVGKGGLRPVMVWIYGGAFTLGSNSALLYGPDFFIEKDIVIVAMNYRLGVVGFLSLGHPDLLGNAGLKDQALALRWVKENIVQFGGNPNSVTIFGQSAGGASVSFHMLSKQSKGLFHRSISMSGTALCPWAYHNPAEAKRKAFYLGSLVGCPTQNNDILLKCLKNTSIDKLVLAASNISMIVPPFAPTVEDVDLASGKDIFLTECPVKAFSNGRFNKVPYMLGFTKDEVLSFLLAPQEMGGIINYAKGVINRVAKNDPDRNHNSKDSLTIFNDTLKNATTEGYISAGTSVLFTAPIDLTQRLISKNNDEKPVYYYRTSYDDLRYSYHRIAGLNINGTGHGADLQFIFNMPLMNFFIPSDPYDPYNLFRQRVVDLYTKFAKYSNPNGVGKHSPQVEWKNSGPTGWQLDINETFALRHRLLDNVTLAYESSLARALPSYSECEKSK